MTTNAERSNQRYTALFQIYDNVGKTVVGPIITAPHEAVAMRHFTDLLSDTTTTLNKHPDDYTLLYLGDQNELTGQINLIPEEVLTGTQWRILNAERTAESLPTNR